MSYTPEEASALLTMTASTVMIGRYITLSAWVLLIYDWVIHLDKEVDLYWKRPWSAAKVLYFCIRFLPIIFLGVHSMVYLSPQVTDRVCVFFFKFEGYTGAVELAVVGLILGFRVLALWNHNKFIIALVGFALVSEVATLLGMLVSTYNGMDATATIIPGVPYHACVPLNLPVYFFALWLPPLGYESLVFLLAIIKGYRTIYSAFSNGGFRSARLLEVMIRDSLWYFLIIFSCDLACSLVWLHAPNYLLQVPVGFGLGGPSLAGSYLLMNLREAYYQPQRETIDGLSGYDHTNGGVRPNSKTYGGGRYAIKTELDTSWALDSAKDLESVDINGYSGVAATSGSIPVLPQSRTIQFHEAVGPTRRPFVEGSSQNKISEEYELSNVANPVHLHSSRHENAS